MGDKKNTSKFISLDNLYYFYTNYISNEMNSINKQIESLQTQVNEIKSCECSHQTYKRISGITNSSTSFYIGDEITLNFTVTSDTNAIDTTYDLKEDNVKIGSINTVNPTYKLTVKSGTKVYTCDNGRIQIVGTERPPEKYTLNSITVSQSTDGKIVITPSWSSTGSSFNTYQITGTELNNAIEWTPTSKTETKNFSVGTLRGGVTYEYTMTNKTNSAQKATGSYTKQTTPVAVKELTGVQVTCGQNTSNSKNSITITPSWSNDGVGYDSYKITIKNGSNNTFDQVDYNKTDGSEMIYAPQNKTWGSGIQYTIVMQNVNETKTSNSFTPYRIAESHLLNIKKITEIDYNKTNEIIQISYSTDYSTQYYEGQLDYINIYDNSNSLKQTINVQLANYQQNGTTEQIDVSNWSVGVYTVKPASPSYAEQGNKEFTIQAKPQPQETKTEITISSLMVSPTTATAGQPTDLAFSWSYAGDVWPTNGFTLSGEGVDYTISNKNITTYSQNLTFTTTGQKQYSINNGKSCNITVNAAPKTDMTFLSFNSDINTFNFTDNGGAKEVTLTATFNQAYNESQYNQPSLFLTSGSNAQGTLSGKTIVWTVNVLKTTQFTYGNQTVTITVKQNKQEQKSEDIEFTTLAFLPSGGNSTSNAETWTWTACNSTISMKSNNNTFQSMQILNQGATTCHWVSNDSKNLNEYKEKTVEGTKIKIQYYDIPVDVVTPGNTLQTVIYDGAEVSASINNDKVIYSLDTYPIRTATPNHSSSWVIGVFKTVEIRVYYKTMVQQEKTT